MTSTRTVDEHGTTIYRNAAGQLHREDGPALEYVDGRKYWFQHGYLHREDGPADMTSEAVWGWYVKGKPHRSGGPAISKKDGSQHFYLHGKRYSKSTYKTFEAAHAAGKEIAVLKASLEHQARIRRGADVLIGGKRYALVAVD